MLSLEASLVETDCGQLGVIGEYNELDESALVIGGWKQNQARRLNVQNCLYEYGISSISVSPFEDSINLETITDLPEVSDLKTIQASILKRSLWLIRDAARDVREVFGGMPNRVLTHSGGANVYLLGLHNSYSDPVLPNRGVLAEPMIAEGLTLRDYTRPAKTHQTKFESGDSSRINFRALAPEGATLDQSKSIENLTSILNSKGATLFAEAIKNGAQLAIILGQEDFAAPESTLVSSLASHQLDPAKYIHHYDNNDVKLGHGYLLDSPANALKDIVPLL